MWLLLSPVCGDSHGDSHGSRQCSPAHEQFSHQALSAGFGAPFLSRLPPCPGSLPVRTPAWLSSWGRLRTPSKELK